MEGYFCKELVASDSRLKFNYLKRAMRNNTIHILLYPILAECFNASLQYSKGDFRILKSYAYPAVPWSFLLIWLHRIISYAWDYRELTTLLILTEFRSPSTSLKSNYTRAKKLVVTIGMAGRKT